MRKIKVQDQLKQKVQETSCQPIKAECASTCLLSQLHRKPRHKHETLLKKQLRQKKKDGGVAQVLECLPNKHKALGPNPSTKINK
jgi:hypothetical protein